MKRLNHYLTLTFLSLLCTQLHAGKLELLKAEGYLTDSLTVENHQFVSTSRLLHDLKFLVIRFDYKVSLDKKGDRISLSSSDTKIQIDKEQVLVRHIGQLKASGNAYMNNETISHYKMTDHDKAFTKVWIYPVPKGREMFTMKFKGMVEMPVKINPELKNKIEAGDKSRVFQSCEITSAKVVDAHHYRLGYAQHDMTSLFLRTSTADNLIKVALLIHPQEDMDFVSLSDTSISLRCKKSKLTRNMLFDDWATANPSLSRGKNGWSKKGYTLTFYAKLPKSCNSIDLLYDGIAVCESEIQ